MNKSSNNNPINQTPKLLLEESAQFLEFMTAYGFTVKSEYDYGFTLIKKAKRVEYHELRGVKVFNSHIKIMEFNAMNVSSVQMLLALHCIDFIEITSVSEFKQCFHNEYSNHKVSAVVDSYVTAWPQLLSHDGLRSLRIQKTTAA